MAATEGSSNPQTAASTSLCKRTIKGEYKEGEGTLGEGKEKEK